MTVGVQLLVPIKPLHLAKTRLRGEETPPGNHAELVTALALDTVLAAEAAERVLRVVVVTSDPELTRRFRGHGVEVLEDVPLAGLNAALRHGDSVLRERLPHARTGALQADLPALRSGELDGAIEEAGSERACCADRQGTGTTLLLAPSGAPLRPSFGPGSAAAHRKGGANPLRGPWDSLRCDVDTGADLRAAARLRLGEHTRAALRDSTPEPFGRGASRPDAV
ncbi:2-phospho-L-lactate guanylyltransferase [Actinopolyspora erythraea]|uniref:Phosphoenolpyruvate guanylyltransferase n=1 Tax=Actinopolyspora erythraea TaxID=414996 RepID=A0A223RQF6_9ACTN|nr:2-phospho-L-lactate guanylyltransferase [Actinopolyspora erythraea]ASU78092.1 2-phospho-L-lactate guanylyltransferase [Actinopolyspora erythraea]